MIYEITTHREQLFPLFAGQTDSVISASLQGYHGRVWADDATSPRSALILCGDFCFLGGIPSAALLRHFPIPAQQERIIFMPPSPEWETLLREVYQSALTPSLRYAMKKEKELLSPEKLYPILDTLPETYHIKQIDDALYHQLLTGDWCKDFVSNFRDAADFLQNGLGFVIVQGEQILSGASSYTRCADGIEVEIATHPDYRKLGLASICGAKLVLVCIERGWYPHWDAANLTSVRLSEKLGYHFSHQYLSYHYMVKQRS